MRVNTHETEQGFTLIETMIAFLILIFGLVALMQLFVAAVVSNTLARSNTFATQAAQQVTDNLKTQYGTWLEGMRTGTNVASDPFPLSGTVQVGVQDTNSNSLANQASPYQVTTSSTYINQFNVSWHATQDERTRTNYRVDITAVPVQNQNFNQPVKVTNYFAP